jgi:hypothetical protein
MEGVQPEKKSAGPTGIVMQVRMREGIAMRC